MQLANIKISNLLSYPYQPNLSHIEWVKFYNRENNNVNVLIWPNWAGKSCFLRILKQILNVGILRDYVYDKKPILEQKNIDTAVQYNEQYLDWINKHFMYQDKPSSVIFQCKLTTHDYYNMKYICRNADIFALLIKKYSTLSIAYPTYTPEKIDKISSYFVLHCDFDIEAKKIVIDQSAMSPEDQFVLLYLQTIELIQICIEIYAEFERPADAPYLAPLKNCIGFVGTNRSFKNISSTISPYAWDEVIGNKKSSDYHSHMWFYLCAKKIRNIVSDYSTLEVTPSTIGNYVQKLYQSDFYLSLVASIKKYINRTLQVEYVDKLLKFVLVDEFSISTDFSSLSDGEQSLLSMIFTLYGYDLNEGMLIVDEPEIHFHPQMQKSFSRMIEKINKNIGTQFIISTYSPLFINESNISNVYRFANIAWATQVKNSNFNLSPDEATLVHLLKFENLSKIFFVNKIIMVEWETDAYFFEFYLNYLHTFPERKSKLKDYEIININGKWWYKLRSKFLDRFGLQSFFVGDWDNIVDYGFMSQDDLWYYYAQAKLHYRGLQNTGKTHRHYNK